MARPVYISEADHTRVSDAVAQAELFSSGEIVTILTDRSDGYVDVALCWAAAAALLGMVALALNDSFYFGFWDWLAGNWNKEHSDAEVVWLTAFFAVIQFAGMMIVQQWTAFRMLLVPGIVKTKRVHARAVACFKVGAERRTHGRTGILIYLSMQEHRAEIVADEAINGKVADEVWGDAMINMLGELKEGRTADAMIAAVESVGKVLAEHFPRAEDDQNELPDRLIEL